MGEPLRTKGKRRIEMTTAEWMGRLVTEIPFEYREGCGEILKLRREKEIKSAVEWLKSELKKGDFHICNDIQVRYIQKKIDEAFEDVIEKRGVI